MLPGPAMATTLIGDLAPSVGFPPPEGLALPICARGTGCFGSFELTIESSDT